MLVVLDLLALILLLRLSSSDAKYDITMLRKVCLGPVVVLVLVSFILLISLPSGKTGWVFIISLRFFLTFSRYDCDATRMMMILQTVTNDRDIVNVLTTSLAVIYK